MLINDLANEIIQKARHGVALGASELEIFLLLFADDLTFLASTVIGLQNQLNLLHSVTARLHLTVNMEKSKVLVFRRGDVLAVRERWHYGGTILEIVNSYKYLGLTFSTKRSFATAVADMAVRGKRSVNEILRTLRSIGCNSPDVFFKLFDTQVVPLLMYSAEIWGHEKYNKLEQVQLYACKRFLRITDRTTNDIVYGELGRFPLWIEANIRCIRYWFKLLKQPDRMYSKKAYTMLMKLDANGKITWVTHIRNLLCDNGFEQVWLFGCANVKPFCDALRERLCSSFCHNWCEHVETSNSISVYRTFKSAFGKETYLSILNVDVFRMAMAQFRMGVSQLYVHKHRFSEDMSLKACPFCENKVETEVHFLFECRMYNNIRGKYLGFLNQTTNLDVSFKSLMTEPTREGIVKLARFIFDAMKLREASLSDEF